MKPRFYVRQGINTWLVMDRLRDKERQDEPVNIKHTRKEARANAQRLNDAAKQDHRADEQQPAVDGELR